MEHMDSDTGFLRLLWQNLFWLIILNLLFLVCCLGIVTIPAAAAALHSACQSILLGRSGLVRLFWHSFRAHLLRAISVGLCFLAGPLLALYGCVFYFQLSRGSGPMLALSVFALVCLYLLFCMGGFAFCMLCRVELGTGAVIRNAFFLTFRCPAMVLGWGLPAFAIPAAIAATFPYSLPWLVLLGAAVPCLIQERGALPIIDTLIVNEEA